MLFYWPNVSWNSSSNSEYFSYCSTGNQLSDKERSVPHAWENSRIHVCVFLSSSCWYDTDHVWSFSLLGKCKHHSPETYVSECMFLKYVWCLIVIINCPQLWVWDSGKIDGWMCCSVRYVILCTHTVWWAKVTLKSHWLSSFWKSDVMICMQCHRFCHTSGRYLMLDVKYQTTIKCLLKKKTNAIKLEICLLCNSDLYYSLTHKAHCLLCSVQVYC